MSSVSKTLKIASRESALALWQSEFIKQQLEQLHPGLSVEIVGMTTNGDQILDVPLAKVGGKGLFVKELEQSLLDGETDIAVHSMKDVPMDFPEGLFLPVICEREVPFDAFVSNEFDSIDSLPQGAKVGTSSLRRASQLKAYRPDLEILSLRGNVNTRLSKLDDGMYDAIILAESGLVRLGFHSRIRSRIDSQCCLPAVGQGALGIECRIGDEETISLIEPLIHSETYECVSAERAMNKRLEGGCQVPIAGFAQIEGDRIKMEGLVADEQGAEIIRVEHESSRTDAKQLGLEIAEELLKRGAGPLLKKVGL